MTCIAYLLIGKPSDMKDGETNYSEVSLRMYYTIFSFLVTIVSTAVYPNFKIIYYNPYIKD